MRTRCGTRGKYTNAESDESHGGVGWVGWWVGGWVQYDGGAKLVWRTSLNGEGGETGSGDGGWLKESGRTAQSPSHHNGCQLRGRGKLFRSRVLSSVEGEFTRKSFTSWGY